MKTPEGHVVQGGWAALAVHSCQKREVSLYHPALVRSLLNQFPTWTAAVVSYQSKYLVGLDPVRCLQKFTMKQKIESLHLEYYASTFSAKQFYLSCIPVYSFWRIWKQRQEWRLWEWTCSRLPRLVCALLSHYLFLAKWTCRWYSPAFLSSHVNSGKCV